MSFSVEVMPRRARDFAGVLVVKVVLYAAMCLFVSVLFTICTMPEALSRS